MAAPNFWDSPESAKQTVHMLKSLKAVIEPVRSALVHSGDLEAMIELLAEAHDAEVDEELDNGLDALTAEVARIELPAPTIVKLTVGNKDNIVTESYHAQPDQPGHAHQPQP